VASRVRSAGTGSKGPRYSDWALVATTSPHHHLLIRRLISRPDQYTFYLCHTPADQPATMTFFVTISGRRWPVEETFKIGKDVLGWDSSQARTWTAQCRHTALAALAQLRQAAIRTSVRGDVPAPPTPQPAPRHTATPAEHVNDADLRIPIGDTPSPHPSGLATATTAGPDPADRRRDRPPDAAGHRLDRRTDHPRPPRVRTALVSPAQTPPSHRPLAPSRHPSRTAVNPTPPTRNR
jgi:hypothetical protein